MKLGDKISQELLHIFLLAFISFPTTYTLVCYNLELVYNSPSSKLLPILFDQKSL